MCIEKDTSTAITHARSYDLKMLSGNNYYELERCGMPKTLVLFACTVTLIEEFANKHVPSIEQILTKHLRIRRNIQL
jgi:hypothetical protein